MIDLTDSQINVIKNADKRRADNLDFFKTFHEKIYTRFKDFKLKNYHVSLNTKLGQLDIYHEGKSIYSDHPVSFAKEELADFYSRYGEKKRFYTLAAPFSGYNLPRYFHKRCHHLIEKSPVTQDNYAGYIMPNFYPLMAFHGVGAGYHVQEFLSSNIVINCLIVENNEELFAASLYIVDWKTLCQPFINDKNKNIHFIVGPIKEEQRLFAYEFHYLSMHCPLYPVTTFLINHKNEDIYKRLTKKVNEDTTAFATVWGHYDDEIYQLNSCLHNLTTNHKIIRPNKPEFIDTPIFIVGGGPSLSERIEQIKNNQKNAIIISCGTAIHSLHHHGIKPDLHFELESHLVTLNHLIALNDKDWLKTIPIIGPTQIPPRVYQLFKQKLMYFKAESSSNFLFGNKDTAIIRGTPTCTNGAISLFLHWGFKNIFLFGVDMGYKDTSNHHAEGSIYYSTNDKDLQGGASVEQEATVSIRSVHDEPMKTKPLLYTAKRTIETCAYLYRKTSTIYNCSNGASMENTTWLSDDEFNSKIIECNLKSMKKEFIDHEIFDNDENIDKAVIKSRIEILESNLETLGNHIISEISKSKNELYDFTCTINNISRFLEMQLKPNLPPFYFFIRGSVWHLLYIGYTHALSIESEEACKDWIETWKKESMETLKGLKSHFSSIVNKKYHIDSDPWTWTPTEEPE